MNNNKSNDVRFLYILTILMFLLLILHTIKMKTNKLEEKIDISNKIETTK